MKNIFQKVSNCVLTYLIGQNGRVMCKQHGGLGDAFNVARHKLDYLASRFARGEVTVFCNTCLDRPAL